MLLNRTVEDMLNGSPGIPTAEIDDSPEWTDSALETHQCVVPLAVADTQKWVYLPKDVNKSPAHVMEDSEAIHAAQDPEQARREARERAYLRLETVKMPAARVDKDPLLLMPWEMFSIVHTGRTSNESPAQYTERALKEGSDMVS